MKVLTWNWLKDRPRKWLSYIILVLVGSMGFLFFRIVNWTNVVGKNEFNRIRKKHNNKEKRNVIIVSNHLTMFDSFFVGIISYYPELIFWPSVAPYHFAAEENYFSNKVIVFFMHCLNALPVNSNRKDSSIMKKGLSLLPKANLHIFPGGRRSKKPLGSNPKRPIKGGIGYILANTLDQPPLVIPVYISGVDNIFGGQPGDKSRARWFPRIGGFFRKPLLRFGDAIEWVDIVQEKGNTKDGWNSIAQRIADSINVLDPSYKPDSK